VNSEKNYENNHFVRLLYQNKNYDKILKIMEYNRIHKKIKNKSTLHATIFTIKVT